MVGPITMSFMNDVDMVVGGEMCVYVTEEAENARGERKSESE